MGTVEGSYSAGARGPVSARITIISVLEQYCTCISNNFLFYS